MARTSDQHNFLQNRQSAPRFLLSVVGICPMLAQIVFIQQILADGAGVRVQLIRIERHFSRFFQNDRMVHRLLGVLSPAERCVVFHEDTRHRRRVQPVFLIRFDDHTPGLQLVVCLNFSFPSTPGYTESLRKNSRHELSPEQGAEGQLGPNW